MDLENIMSIMSNLENNTSPKIYLYPAKILQVRKCGLIKYQNRTTHEKAKS